MELTKKKWSYKKWSSPNVRIMIKTLRVRQCVLLLFLIQTIKILARFFKEAVVVWQDLFYEFVGCICCLLNLLAETESARNENKILSLGMMWMKAFRCSGFTTTLSLYQGSPRSRVTGLFHEDNSAEQRSYAYIYPWIWKK